MRIIITGGTGLIGRALTDELVQHEHEVIILSRSPERAGGFPAGVEVVGWDARTADGWGHLADGAGAIVNLAGASIAGQGFLPQRWTPERRRVIRDSRLNAGRAVVEAVEAAEDKPQVVIQSSAIGYYGPRGSEIVTEASEPGDDFLAQLCVDWEAATEAVEDVGVRRAIIRTGIVLSTEDGALPRMLLPYKIFVGGPFGDGRQYMSWIHLADEAAAIRFLIENQAASGPFNLTAPNPLTNAEFGQVLGRVLNRPSWLPVPGFAMRLLFGEVATVVLDGQRVLPERLKELGFSFQFPTAEEALKDTLADEVSP